MKFGGLINTFKKIIPFGDNEEKPELGTDQLDAMKERIATARQILSDPTKTHYHIVMIPEEMSIFESERTVETLKEYNIPVEGIVVNQLIPENHNCEFCTEKRKLQQERMASINQKFNDFKIMELPLFKEEVKGQAMLERTGQKLYSS